MSEFYITEEKAFATGIAGEWPKIIPKPNNPHGRLRKITLSELKELINQESSDKDLMISNLYRLAKAQEDLLVAYRIVRQPKEKTLDVINKLKPITINLQLKELTN